MVFHGQSDHSHPSRAKFKNQWSYTSTQPVCLHGTYWDNLLHPTYVHLQNIMNSFNNKPHYIVLCPSVINPLYTSDIHLTTFFLKVPQNILFFQCMKSHFTHIKMKRIFDLLVDHTFHCKWYCKCSESQNKDFLSCKLHKIHSLKSNFCFNRRH